MSIFSMFPSPSTQKQSYLVPKAAIILDIYYQKWQVDISRNLVRDKSLKRVCSQITISSGNS
jgi:hypothetical protein